MTEHLRAYNSLWQVRSDSWCRLEEAADRLIRPTTAGALKEKWVSNCQELLAQLSTLEPYWAFPGSPQFARVQRLFAAGNYDKFAQAVLRINRALTTESYRSGDVENAGADELDIFPTDPRQLEHQPPTQGERPYFEVLVVEKMTEAQPWWEWRTEPSRGRAGRIGRPATARRRDHRAATGRWGCRRGRRSDLTGK